MDDAPHSSSLRAANVLVTMTSAPHWRCISALALRLCTGTASVCPCPSACYRWCSSSSGLMLVNQMCAEVETPPRARRLGGADLALVRCNCQCSLRGYHRCGHLLLVNGILRPETPAGTGTVTPAIPSNDKASRLEQASHALTLASVRVTVARLGTSLSSSSSSSAGSAGSP